MAGGRVHLFSPRASEALGSAVAEQLGTVLSPLEQRDFEDGEYKLRPLTSVRGGDAYVLHSLASTSDLSPDDQLCRLLFLVGALRDAGVDRLTVFAPYLCYGRKDRRTKPRDPVTTRYLAQLLEAMGADRVVSVDVHNRAAFDNAFRIPALHLTARPLFVDWVKEALEGRRCVVVSPDIGGVKRAGRYRDALQDALGDDPVPLAFMEKYRSRGVVSGDRLAGDVEQRVAIIVDDLISSGSTMRRAAEASLAKGAERVWALATHGLFAGKASRELGDPSIERIVVTDSVAGWRLPAGAVRDKVTWLDLAPLLADAIERLVRDASLLELMD